MKAFIIHQIYPKLFSNNGSNLNKQRFQRSTGVDIPTPRAGSLPARQTTITRIDQLQMLFLSAEMQKAFTIFLAGAAFTLMVLPKASLVPAFLAGLILVLIMQRPGIVNLPAFFTSAVARLAKLSRRSRHCFLFSPLLRAKASPIPPLERDLADTAFFFMAFIAFMATIVEMSCENWYCTATISLSPNL